MQIYALFMFLGIFTTLLIPETKRKTLEELSGEFDLQGERAVEPAVLVEEKHIGSGDSHEAKSV